MLPAVVRLLRSVSFDEVDDRSAETKEDISLNCARKIILSSELQENIPLQRKAEYNTTSRRDDGRLQVKEMMAGYK